MPERRTPGACIVAALGVLDLDDARAQIAQDLAGKGRRHAVADLQHQQVLQWSNGSRLFARHARPLRSIGSRQPEDVLTQVGQDHVG